MVVVRIEERSYIYILYITIVQLNFQRYTKWHLDGSVSEISENLDFNRKNAQNKSLGQQAQISMKEHSKCQDLQRFSQIS